MKVLYGASEVAPFAKTGGLADVAGSLPKALRGLGADVRVILPLYGTIVQQYRDQMKFLLYTYVDLAWRKQYCGLLSLELDGVTYYFVDNEYYFKRDHLYGFHDEAERYAFFSLAIVRLLPMMDWTPDVIHCNDWQTALVPIYLRQEQATLYQNIRTVFTIHNIEYQGRFPADTMGYVFGLPQELYDGGLLRFDDQVNLMKGVMYRADLITTVSPSYANELRDPTFACGLNRIVEENSHKLRGIINGIDYSAYDPETDQRTYCAFSKGDMSGKAVNKSELQRNLGLYMEPDRPIIACVSRLVGAKGFDMVNDAIDEIMGRSAQMVILGTGDPWFEQRFRDAQARYPGRFSANIQYSDVLARRIYAGADLFLMPSRWEPCGLAQMIAMRYGTVPMVRQTGGLKDSVIPYPAQNSNGFAFAYCSREDMMGMVHRALDLWYTDKDAWYALMRRCMEADFTWERSAREYLSIYMQLTGAR